MGLIQSIPNDAKEEYIKERDKIQKQIDLYIKQIVKRK